jgi:hypothetical protein
MNVVIDKPIVGYSVVSPETVAKELGAKVEGMNETVERPEMLMGATYKLRKMSQSDHAMYVTINDIILNHGTEHETRQPFEIFINSKNMGNFQWVVALTRVISAVFRKGGDNTFLVDEMKAVFDPQGGYFKPGGGGYMPSIVAELGYILEKHMRMIGLLEEEQLSAAQQELISAKRAEYEALKEPVAEDSGDFPPDAKMCGKCHAKATIVMDGCMTCLNCGDSKCG